MAKRGSPDVAFFLLDGMNILGVLSSIEDGREEVTEETTPLGAANPTHEAVGMREFSLSQEGWYDDATDGVHDALVAVNAAPRVLSFGYSGNVIGRPVMGYAGILQPNYSRVGSVRELHKASAEYLGSGVAEEALILHTLEAETADGNTESDSVDGTAQSSAGGAAYLQITDIDLGGYDDLTVTVRDSADDMTYADLVAFSTITAAPGAQRVTVAGTVERYLAVDWEFGGTGTSPTATFMAAFARY